MDFERFLADLARHCHGGPDNVVVLDDIDSTNRLARAIAAEYESERQSLPRALILALEQTAGRGRQGRSWTSPAGRGVYATLVTWLDDPARLASLPLLAGVGLARGLAPLLPPGSAAVRLKWPNDLVVGGQKIGGILIETALRTDEGAVVILGFGVNHGHTRDELPIAAATSLALLGGTATLGELACRLAEALDRELEHAGDLSYALAAYRELSAHAPGDRLECRSGDETISGTFLGFDDAGSLRLATASGEMAIPSGEVIG